MRHFKKKMKTGHYYSHELTAGD